MKFGTIMHWPKAHSGKLFSDARVSRARFIRKKRVFGGSRKTCFSGITFFFVDLVESGQSKVCRASDARNFVPDRFVGIKAL